MTDIVLCTLNAKWEHASFGLRCLHANLGPLKERAAILERTIHDRPSDVVEAILEAGPRVVGFGVYIWNASALLEVVRQLRALAPSVCIVLGGPEVSHETQAQEIVQIADHVVTGEGEDAFRALCDAVLAAPGGLRMALEKIIAGGKPNLATLASPYPLYTDTDIAHRIVYVEASRGCPFTCEFCLSALDDGVRAFPQDAFLAELRTLLARGLRRFKFVDRTFNLRLSDATGILRFFLDALADGQADESLFLHFEMIPDRLPDALRELLALFPAGMVQLEVGIQSLDKATEERISRRQNVPKLEENIRHLRAHTGVHIHADLIVGLPGEDFATFGRGFDQLYALAPHEIQVGVLKRLRGAPLARHTAAFAMQYSTSPPYEVLQTSTLAFADVQRLKRFARMIDLVHNSGRFPQAARLIAGDAPFAGFLRFADWMWATTHATSGIALARLAALVTTYLIDVAALPADTVHAVLAHDLGRDKVSHLPKRQSRHAG